ncbi:OLC1v1002951C1 [Oldenlandia corymbosa var. corymbosa]|uniref:OLC1v1002951C1 n=1 Tax=Oldenlandia corymbosa var. corymbosa TaxID=529605 RepID=A0AAV1DBT3_OLDCO|nr:OLC1v1002951C1 [Oldenlandia corymbosa var. corymbosa]
MAGVGITKMTHTVPIRHMKASLVGSRRLHGNKLNNPGAKRKGPSGVRDDDHDADDMEVKKEDWPVSCCWMPHYRTGIYYPKGHEAIMEDIPEGAACFGDTTYWMRNIDGVDKPDG